MAVLAAGFRLFLDFFEVALSGVKLGIPSSIPDTRSPLAAAGLGTVSSLPKRSFKLVLYSH